MTETSADRLPMSWLGTLFNPSGTSTKIEFTRAWTLLFFLQLGVVMLPWFISFVMGLTGGDGRSVGRFGLYLSPIVFIVTTVMSYIIHTRRLRDAGKSTLFAILILLPLLLGVGLFGSSVAGKSAEYASLYEQRQKYLDDPIAFRERKAEMEQEKLAEAKAKCLEAVSAASGESETTEEDCEKVTQNGRGQGQRGPGGQEPTSPENPLPSQGDFILRPNLSQIQTIIIPLSGLLAIWSLLWVARAKRA
ncbi:MAG: DUF805 domain-containing protein [Pseudomonadota bacterium]